MAEPEAGRMIRSASDQCPGTIQWVDPGRSRIGVLWHDGTTSTEPTGDERGWEWMDGWGHVCGVECRCPEHGSDTWYHPGSGTHACQRVDCRYAGGLEDELVRQHERLRQQTRGPGWEPTHPPHVPGA